MSPTTRRVEDKHNTDPDKFSMARDLRAEVATVIVTTQEAREKDVEAHQPTWHHDPGAQDPQTTHTLQIPSPRALSSEGHNMQMDPGEINTIADWSKLIRMETKNYERSSGAGHEIETKQVEMERPPNWTHWNAKQWRLEATPEKP